MANDQCYLQQDKKSRRLNWRRYGDIIVALIVFPALIFIGLGLRDCMVEKWTNGKFLRWKTLSLSFALLAISALVFYYICARLNHNSSSNRKYLLSLPFPNNSVITTNNQNTIKTVNSDLHLMVPFKGNTPPTYESIVFTVDTMDIPPKYKTISLDTTKNVTITI